MKTILHNCRGILPVYTVLAVWAFLSLEITGEDQIHGVMYPGADIHIQEMEFINRPLGEILIALARFAEIPILPASDLSNLRSYYFRDIQLNQLLAEIVAGNDLYFQKEQGLWRASRIQIIPSEQKLFFTVHAKNSRMESIINRLSELSGIPIRSRSLPARGETVHMEHMSLDDILSSLLLPYPEYRIQFSSGAYHIHDERQIRSTGGEEHFFRIEHDALNPGLYSIQGNGGSGGTALKQLFQLEGVQYQLFGSGSDHMDPMELHACSFDQALEAICSNSGLRTILHEEVYFVFPSQTVPPLPALQQDMVHISTYTPRYYSSDYLASAVPEGLLSDCIIRKNSGTSSLVIHGSRERSSIITGFLTRLDSSYKMIPRKVHLNHISFEDLTRLLPPAYPPMLFPSSSHPDTMYALLEPEGHTRLKELLRELDTAPPSLVVPLKYHSFDAVRDALPSSFSSENIQKGLEPGTFLYYGSEQKARELLSWIENVDLPKPNIEYHILALQYQKSSRSAYGVSAAAAGIEKDSSQHLGAGLSRVLGLNFDIISNFGYIFALDLEADLSRSAVRIVADSMISAADASAAKLENTSTYRYRDSSGETAITREITSGLTISINGRILGALSRRSQSSEPPDVDMDVSIELSRRGVDSGPGNPPPTSQRTIQTQALCAAGTVLRVAGSLINEEGGGRNGLFPFGTLERYKELNEFVLYIRPVIRRMHSTQIQDLPAIDSLHSQLFQEPGK